MNQDFCKPEENLYLVATAHTDPDGMDRLTTFLNRVNPKRILIEISKDRAERILQHSIDDKMREHEKEMDRWAKQGFNLSADQRDQILELARFKNENYGFEIRAALVYQQEMPSCEIDYIDVCVPRQKRRFVAGLREMVGIHQELTPQMRRSIEEGLSYPVNIHKQHYRADIEIEYRRAYQMAHYYDQVARNPQLFEIETRGLSLQAKEAFKYVIDPERNVKMAKTIRKKHEEGGGTVATIGATHAYLIRPLLEEAKIIPLNMVDAMRE